MQKAISILKESFPVIVMVALIPMVKNDFLLTALYMFSIIMLLWTRRGGG
ncbi:MAG: hypothetical protein Q7R64_04880 [bacterium]|nr:hypothetical protein [bacterium]